MGVVCWPTKPISLFWPPARVSVNTETSFGWWGCLRDVGAGDTGLRIWKCPKTGTMGNHTSIRRG